MKQSLALITTAIGIFIFSSCHCIPRAGQQPPVHSMPVFPDTPAESLPAWPVQPVVRAASCDIGLLRERFGEATPFVINYLSLWDGNKLAPSAAVQQGTPPELPAFFGYQHWLLQASSLPDLTQSQKQALETLILQHHLCVHIAQTFAKTAVPTHDAKSLEAALKAANSLRRLRESLKNVEHPAWRQFEKEAGDPLGHDWAPLFTGMKPLSPLADAWQVATADVQADAAPRPCRYGQPFPTAAKQAADFRLCLSTTLPANGKTPVTVIFRGLPPNGAATLDGKPLPLEYIDTAARLTIPPQQITGQTQSLAIVWKIAPNKPQCIFRQPWFVMKN